MRLNASTHPKCTATTLICSTTMMSKQLCSQFPTQYRTEVALRAFERGKHVLIEKPIAMNAAEVEQLIAARGDLISGCCSSRNRFSAAARLATQLITTGGLGELRTVHCRAIRGAGKEPDTPRPAWRLTKALNGGGILVNWGCYDLDYLLGITGWQLKPQTVFAQTWTVPQVFNITYCSRLRR